MKKDKLKYYGFFSFFGFVGFTYFVNHNVSSLFFFSFFSLASFFVLGYLLVDTPDERYIENSNKAKLKTTIIPLFALFFIGWGSSYPFFTKEFVVLVSALGWAFTFIAYAILFAYYEKN